MPDASSSDRADGIARQHGRLSRVTQFVGRGKVATSPGAARALIEVASLIDVRGALSAVQAATLVLHCRDDSTPASTRAGIAEHIPGARFIELDGTDHFIAVDPDRSLIRSRTSSAGSDPPARP